MKDYAGLSSRPSLGLLANELALRRAQRAPEPIPIERAVVLLAKTKRMSRSSKLCCFHLPLEVLHLTLIVYG